MAMPPRVLVVEDDPRVADVVERYLRREGMVVTVEADGDAGLRRALGVAPGGAPDVIVLDLMLPGLSGIEVCRRLRASVEVPVIVLSALGSEVDRITGLELGADDYLAKPFSPRELVARVRALLRRSQGEVLVGPRPEAPLAAGGLRLDRTSRECLLHGRPVALTVKEWDLLELFMRHPRRAFRRGELLERVWGYDYGDGSTVTVHVRRLREKVEAHPSAPDHIRTVRGVGYRFEP